MASLRELIIKISANSQSFQSEISRASRMGADYYKTMQNGGRQASAAAKESQRALSELNSQFVSMKSAAAGLVGAMSASALITMADNWGQVTSRMKMATQSGDELAMVQRRLMEISDRTYKPIEEQSELFIRSATAMKELGYSTAGTIDFIDSISSALTINAASADKGASAIDALSKSMVQGKVSGDEWKTVMEVMPTIVGDIARTMNTTETAVKKLASDGKLSMQQFADAVIAVRQRNAELAEDMPTTVGDAITKLSNHMKAYVGDTNSAYGTTQALSGGISTLADNIDTVAAAGAVLVGIGFARYFGGMTTGAYSATAGLISAAKSEVALAEAQLRGTQIATARARASVYRAQQALVAARGTDAQAAAEKKLAATQTIVTRNIAARTAAQTTLNNVTAIGSRLMSGALGLVGGIPGMVLLAAGAWYTMYQNQEQARQSALQYASTLDDVVEKAKDMNPAQLSGAIADSDKSIDALKDKLSELKDRQAAAGAEVKKYTELAKGMRVENDANNGYVINAAKAQREYNQITRDVSDTTDQLNRAVENQSRLQNELAGKVSASEAAFKSIQNELISTYSLAKSTAGMMATTIQFLNQVNQSAPKSPTREIENEAYTKYIQQQKESLELLRKEGVERAKLKALQDATKSGAIKTDVSGNILPGQESQISQIQSNAASEYGLQQAEKDKNKKSDAQKIEESYKNITKQQREQIALSGQTTELAKMKYQVVQGELSTLSDIQKTELLRNATSLDHIKTQEKFKELQEELLTPEEALLAKTRERVALLKQVAPATEQYRDAMERISKASITEAPKFNGIDASVGGPSGELIKVAEAQKELEKWHKKQLDMQKKLLDEKEINEQTYADRIADINLTNTSKMEDIQHAYASASLGVFSDLTGQTAQMLQGMGKEGSAAYKTLFLASKAAAIAQTLISTEVSAMKAMELGPIFGIPASTAIRAMGYASVALIAGQTIAGMAHDGIDRVPETGTWLLQKGERVVTAQTSAKLDSTLESVQQQKQEDRAALAAMGDINIHNSYTGKPDDSVMAAIDQRNKSVIKQIRAELTKEIITPQGQFGKALKVNYFRSRKE